MSTGSVTNWLADLKHGDPVASQRVWERYFEQLVRIASQRIRKNLRRTVDEEDVALAAFASFFRGIEQGRFAQLNDRHDLWQILLVLTERRVVDHIRRARADKRGGDAVVGESAVGAGGENGSGLAGIAGHVPPPDFALEVSEQLEKLLQALGDHELRELALCKLEGYTNREIVEKLGLSLRSVERRLALIRQIWQEDSG